MKIVIEDDTYLLVDIYKLKDEIIKMNEESTLSFAALSIRDSDLSIECTYEVLKTTLMNDKVILFTNHYEMQSILYEGLDDDGIEYKVDNIIDDYRAANKILAIKE